MSSLLILFENAGVFLALSMCISTAKSKKAPYFFVQFSVCFGLVNGRNAMNIFAQFQSMDGCPQLSLRLFFEAMGGENNVPPIRSIGRMFDYHHCKKNVHRN